MDQQLVLLPITVATSLVRPLLEGRTVCNQLIELQVKYVMICRDFPNMSGELVTFETQSNSMSLT